MAGRGRRLLQFGVLSIAVLLSLTVLPLSQAALAAEGTIGTVPVRQDSCGYGPSHRVSKVVDAGLREASALVASRDWPGVYWSLNDSGNSPTLFAFDEDGQPRGTYQVPDATNVDWEALQLGPDGEGGTALYVGDVGNNMRQRYDLTIYRVPEPEPAPPGVQAGAGATAPATPLRFKYPTTPGNAEAMLIHPETGEIVLLSRAPTGYSLIYSVPIPPDSEHASVLEFVDVLDVRAYDSSSPPLNGQITDAAISDDAKHVVLRTYTSALVYDVPEGASLTRIWDQQPKVYPLADGPKGEGISFRHDSTDLLSIGEGVTPVLFETPWHC